MNHRCRLGNDKPASAESKRTSGLLQPVVCCLLQRVENSSVSWQRRSNPSCHPARRPHRIGAGRRGPSPPLLSNLVFGTDTPLPNHAASYAIDCRTKAEAAPSDLTRKYWLDMAAHWVRLAEDTDKRA